MNGTTPRGRPLDRSLVRTLMTTSSVYRAVLRDALSLVEGAQPENPSVLVAYDCLAAQLRAALDDQQAGSTPKVLRACARLLGKEAADG